MNKTFLKTTIRTIKNSLGRYLAILCIIALGVGFFSGLKVCRNAMVATGEDYIDENILFDLKLLSYMGFTDENIEEIEKLEYIDYAEGAVYEDFIYVNEENERSIFRAHSITNNINLLSLKAGRMAEKSNECVVDARYFDEDDIGKYIEISDVNSDETKNAFKSDKYEIVGVANSPVYLNQERGTTNVGNGQLSAFVYILLDGFEYLAYEEVYTYSENSYEIYSEEYDDYLEELKEDISGEFDNLAYVSTRNENVGYLSFDNDSAIVDGIAKVFPVFFFMIAALVCSTTMTRMIDDERTQIGSFRALGYSSGVIMSKYVIYSGTAAIVGCIIGYFAGIKVFPAVIWAAYGMMYGFAEIEFYFDVTLLVISIIVSLACSVGTTYFACKSKLFCTPAELIRPATPPAGKRVFLEYVGFMWKKLKFLHKVTIRNIFRFKKRMFMMIIGIAGCTVLVLAGFGLDDSISNLANFQYDEIETYDLRMTFADEVTEDKIKEIKKISDEKITATGVSYNTTLEYISEDGLTRGVNLVVSEGYELSEFADFHMDGEDVEYPRYAYEVIISDKLADIADVEVGDSITFKTSDNDDVVLEVSGIYENYVWHYAYIKASTYEEVFKKEYVPNTLYANIEDGADPYDVYTKIDETPGILNTNIVSVMRERVEDMMEMLNAVIVLVIVCAGALAFIVLFNLSNINITERQREIATIKVLGFYKSETGAYVFRENLILTFIGILVGLPVGTVFLDFVLAQINVDMVSIKPIITAKSIIFTVLTVLVFFEVVDLVMRKKIEKINMAESLKSVE
ncbi:MAG: ABC transporter permease [Lachnospiraceae bacterium]|nr:ABC transporter permease [Lachnospiraceae bacterium]